MKRAFFILCCLFTLGLSVRGGAEGFGTCGGGCYTYTDCPTDCKECVNLGGGLECSTCCVHDEEAFCQSPCEWKVGYDGNMQCQNPGVDCSGVPEVPSQHKGLRIALIAALMVGGLWGWQKKKIKTKSV